MYKINNNTMVIIPNKGFSKIIEYDSIVINSNSPFEIISYNCLMNFSSFNGRVNSTKFLTNIKYKCPIIINEAQKIIFFPIFSYKNSNCIWINLKCIKNYKKIKNDVQILFFNDENLIINVSFNIFNNQFYKSTRLLSILDQNR